MKTRLLLSLLLFCFAGMISLAFVAPAGILSGTIKDPKGAVISGAQVTVRNEATAEGISNFDEFRNRLGADRNDY